MALPPLATLAAMEVRLGVPVGSLTGADKTRAEAALDDVSALVRDEAGRDWVNALNVAVAPPGVAVVVLQAAMRCYRNPEGLTGESVGPYSWQGQQGETTLYLTDSEIRAIHAAVRAEGTGWTGTGSVRTPSAYDSPAPVYLGELPL